MGCLLDKGFLYINMDSTDRGKPDLGRLGGTLHDELSPINGRSKMLGLCVSKQPNNTTGVRDSKKKRTFRETLKIFKY